MEQNRFAKTRRCRICGNQNLVAIVNVGIQSQTGVFPTSPEMELTRGPLELVKCHGNDAECCGLVQLANSYEPAELYGDNYGYRSGLNQTMVRHLAELVANVRRIVEPGKGDLVIDIGSNDGTLLSCYPPEQATLVGVDPTGAKFRKFYRPDIQLIPDFFSAAVVRAKYGARQRAW